jgi:hypothetical protein
MVAKQMNFQAVTHNSSSAPHRAESFQRFRISVNPREVEKHLMAVCWFFNPDPYIRWDKESGFTFGNGSIAPPWLN